MSDRSQALRLPAKLRMATKEVRIEPLPRNRPWPSAEVAAELRYGAAKLGQPQFHAAVEAWHSTAYPAWLWRSGRWVIECHHYAQHQFPICS